jgi:hypothetical protein
MRLNPRKPLRQDDSGVAGAIGIVLVLAVVIAAYGNAVRTEIPVFGAAAERQWDQDVGETFRQLSRSLGAGLTAGAPMATLIPPPPAPGAVEIPILGRREPVPPGGVVGFMPSCASLSATHEVTDGRVINDLRAGAIGCLTFQSETVYSPSFAYRVEMGGLLRVQGERAVVLAGPPLELDAGSPDERRVALGVPGLRGDASTSTIAASSGRIDLVPGPHSGEIEQEPNAANASWQLTTSYPEAWRTWFETRFSQAGFVAARAAPGPGQSSADFVLSCAPADCTRGPDGLGTLTVRIEGPRTDTNDLKLSLTYGLFDINVR